jgi:hypothetical protein
MSRQVPHFRRTAIALLTSALALPFAAQAFQVCPVQPCRILDTRLGSGDAFGGAPHRLSPNETMSIDATEGFIAGQGGASNCGVPFPVVVKIVVAFFRPPWAGKRPA